MINKTVKIILLLILSAGIALIALSCKQSGSLAKKISEEDKKALLEHLTSNYQSPEDYVVTLFEDHDIVFIGESHWVKNYLDFLHSLMPALHKNGIYNLGYEFGCYIDQEDIDRLVFGDEYDEMLARDITIKHNVFKGNREYVDVFKVAWEINQSLPPGAQKFRIVGLDTPRDLSVMKPEDDYYDLKTRRRIISDGIHRHDHRNDYWAVVIGKEFLVQDKKALIYSHTGHSSVKFRVDRSSTTPFFTSAGNKIYNAIEDRVAEVVLNHEYSEFISELISTLPPEYQRGGIDLMTSPFGHLPSSRKGYYKGRISDFTMKDVFQGVLYLGPVSEYEPVTLIPNFINSENLALANARVRRNKDRTYTAEELNKLIEESLPRDIAELLKRDLRK